MAEKEEALIAKKDEILRYLTSVLRGESQSEVVVVEGQGDGWSEAKLLQKAPDELNDAPFLVDHSTVNTNRTVPSATLMMCPFSSLSYV